MTTHFLEIEYTRANGSTFRETGTQTIAHVDGRFGAWRATDSLIQNARFIASSRYPATLKGVTRARDYSGRVYSLPDGSRDVALTPMTSAERADYLSTGGYVHP